MPSIRSTSSTGRNVLLSFAASALCALPLAAEPVCQRVHGRFDIVPVENCASPVGVCGQGRFSGGLRGPYTSQFLTFVPTAETETTGVLLFSAEATLQARLSGRAGELTFKEAGAFRTTSGEFAEILTVVSGTGGFVGATGVLTSTGSVDATLSGGGVYDGTLCLD